MRNKKFLKKYRYTIQRITAKAARNVETDEEDGFISYSSHRLD